MGNDISFKQNEDVSVNMIAAFRQKYTDVKRLAMFQVVLSVWLPVTLSLATLSLKNPTLAALIGSEVLDISMFVSFICVAIALADLLLFSRFIESGKELAANIQERFDTHVLSLPWNTIVVGSKVANEDIFRLKKKHFRSNGNPKSALLNWYNPKISDVEHNQGVLLCQRMNLYWDKTLRETVNTRVSIALFCWIVFIVGVALYQDLTLQSLLLTVLCPMFPILFYALKLVSDNTKSIATLTRLKELLDNTWDDAHKRVLTTEKLREVQNQIFLHRKTNRPISDCFYWKRKQSYETDAQYSIEQMIEELMQAE